MSKVYEYGSDKRRFIISPVGTNSMHVNRDDPSLSNDRITIEVDEKKGNYAAEIDDNRQSFTTVGAAVEAACKYLTAREDRVIKLRNGMATFVDDLPEDERPF